MPCRNFAVGQEPDPPNHYSPFATRHSPFAISLLAIRCRFGSAGASPSHFIPVPRPTTLVPLKLSAQALRHPAS